MGLGMRAVAVAAPDPAKHLLRGAESPADPAVASCDAACAAALPGAVDWVAGGAVTSVKNQEQCGSCWSFSAAGALEGAYFVAGHRLVDFSESNIAECDIDGDDKGCNGGLMDNAFDFISANGGLCTEKAYPYVPTQGKCKADACKIVPGSKVANVTDVTPYSEASLRAAVAQQPVSIAIEADQRDFQLYASGVMSGTCGDMLDHGVLVVGYGFDNDSGEAFWKVRVCVGRRRACAVALLCVAHPSAASLLLMHRSRTRGARPGARRATSGCSGWPRRTRPRTSIPPARSRRTRRRRGRGGRTREASAAS